MSSTEQVSRPRRALEPTVDPAVVGGSTQGHCTLDHLIKRHLPWWLAALLVILSTGGATFALWTSHITTSPGVIMAGDFEFTLGDLDWSSPTENLGGDGVDTLAGAHLGDGDVLILEQNIDSTFDGTNLQVSFSIDMSGLPDGTEASWHIKDADGNRYPADQDVSLKKNLVPSTIVRDGQITWQIVVTLTMPHGTTQYGDPLHPPAPKDQGSVEFGTMTIKADQVTESAS